MSPAAHREPGPEPSPVRDVPLEEAHTERSESVVISENTDSHSVKVGITIEDKARVHTREGGKDCDISLYTVYRDYVKHEDDLINNRLNWNFTIRASF